MLLSPHSQDVWKSHNTERKKKEKKKLKIKPTPVQDIQKI